MSAPIWTTVSGKLDSINERELYSKQLQAYQPGLQAGQQFSAFGSSTITYKKIAGTLPPGLHVSSAGMLEGVPFEVEKRKSYKFVIRATNAEGKIADRTFSIEVSGADAPIFTTADGQLDFSDSTSTDTLTKWVIDGSEVNYQILATDTDTATGQSLVYDIVEGNLPTGLSMSTNGKISGIIQLSDDEKYGPRGGYSFYNYDDNPYDPTIYSKSLTKNYEFKVRVTDGASVATQYNNILVISADFWRIDNTEITIDQNTYLGSPLTIDLSTFRRPVFITDSELGTYRHDNNIIIKIDVDDFDPLQADLTYEIIAGALPTGLGIDSQTGEIYGQLPAQAAVSVDYEFTIRAKRIPQTGISVYTDKQFKLTLIGEIDVGVTFTTPSNLGSVTAGIPSLKKLEATAVVANRVLTYKLTAGALPNGLTLSSTGNIIGVPRIKNYTNFDTNGITFDTNTTSIDREFNFSVEVSDQYKTVATTRDFSLKIALPHANDYGNLVGHGTSEIDKNVFYQIAQDPQINNSDYVFRAEDPNFGLPETPQMLLVAGLQPNTLSALQEQIAKNHEPKTLYFGDLKTAVAKEDGKVKYEVVYIEMKDNLVNNSGKAVSSEITLRSDINKPLLGPVGSDGRITADRDVYDITTDSGLSFSVSGSKVRYANQLTADLDYVSKLYPNAVANMRSQMKSLGQKEWLHLPLWMRTIQEGDGAPLGYKMAIVVAYCNPGQSNLVKQRITTKAIDFKKITFTIDRYVVGQSLNSPASFTGDGTATSFTMNHIVNDEDIKITIDDAIVYNASVDNLNLYSGNSTFTVDARPSSGVMNRAYEVTADNSQAPTYLGADTTIRSADLINPFTLSHDLTNKKTTITFSEAPADKSIISIDYTGDKYLVFRRKGI